MKPTIPNYRLIIFYTSASYLLERRIFGFWFKIKKGKLVEIQIPFQNLEELKRMGSNLLWIRYHKHCGKIYNTIARNPQCKNVSIHHELW